MEEDLLDSNKLQAVLPTHKPKGKPSAATSYTIGGVKVDFPVKAYPSQISMMNQVIQGCNKAKNCLLESPTGSGKTLALLCSVLAWQKKEKEILRQQVLAQAQDKKNLEEQKKLKATNSPLLKPNKIPGHLTNTNIQKMGAVLKGVEFTDNDDDDDFMPPKRLKIVLDSNQMTDDSAILNSSVISELDVSMQEEATSSSSSLFDVHKLNVPNVSKIFYGTRTHKQITQIVRELKKTAYKDEIRMTILSSRKHSCINDDVLKAKENINDLCQELKETEGKNCRNLSSFKKILPVNLGGKGLLQEIWDIEELVTLGRKTCSCPYYAARELLQTADIVFCPYNYIIDPMIRKSLQLNLAKSVILLDEAHNIEDVSRDSASGSFELQGIRDAMQDCEQAAKFNNIVANELRSIGRFLSTLAQWIDNKKSEVKEDVGNAKGTASWSGTYMVASFTNEGLGLEQYTDFKNCLAHITRNEEDLRQNQHKSKMDKLKMLNGKAKNLLDSVDFILGLLYSGTNCEDYHVCMESSLGFDQGQSNRWYHAKSTPMSVKYTLHFWCLNSALVFSEIKSAARSVILTSGTLAPLDSFASELGTLFPIKLEANHVIDKEQVLVAALGQGPQNIPLQALYKNTMGYDFQDELGRLVLEVCQTVPYGVLCFLSSYSLMDKLVERWSATRLLDRVRDYKNVYSEPRRNDELENVMFGYFSSIKQAELKVSSSSDKNTGALLFTIFRGKISEGIDFSDNCARAVISVGIPYPSVQDEKVKLKRTYNDTHSHKKGLLKGADWYQIQAYRALNQALGRCLRHRYDWGAILLVDQRFSSSNSQKGLSKWVRNQVQNSSSHASFIESLKAFVRRRMEVQEEEERARQEEENIKVEEEMEDVMDSNGRDSQSSANTNSAGSIQQQVVDFTIVQNHVVVYTDGACSGNGQLGASAGFGVYFGENHPLNLARKVTGRATNNNAEIQGAIHALRQAKLAQLDRVCIRTDSKFMIQCIQEWMPKWRLNGWKTSNNKPVLNKEELQELAREVNGMSSVKWEYVPGHSNVLGNERADAMARHAAERSK